MSVAEPKPRLNSSPASRPPRGKKLHPLTIAAALIWGTVVGLKVAGAVARLFLADTAANDLYFTFAWIIGGLLGGLGMFLLCNRRKLTRSDQLIFTGALLLHTYILLQRIVEAMLNG